MGFLRQMNACFPHGSEPLMEQRLFKLFCLAVTLLTLFVVLPTDYLIHHSLGIAWADLAYGTLAFFCYRESCRGRYHIAALFFLFMLNQNLTWFASGGSQGSVSFYFFIAFIYQLIFFRGGWRLLMLAASVANLVGLIAVEPYFPQWIVPFHDQVYRQADLIITLVICGFSCALMLCTVLTNYDREQRRLRSLNAEMERNLNDRIQAEKSLRQSQQLLNAIVEGTSDSVFAKDSQGRYILINSAAASITGKSPAQALGNDDTVLFTCDDARIIMEADRQILASGETRYTEHQLLNAQGQKITMQATKGPLRDERGRIVGLFGISRDITESRRAEDEIRMLNEELDRRVNERTARLVTAMQEQESFSYSVSHDLRAPLRHINSYSAILTEECGKGLSQEALAYLARIRAASSKMGGLIDDLLELSRIGRYELQKKPVDLSELALDVAGKLRESEPERLGRFAIAEQLTVHGDQVLLRQLLENLLGNAWKYSNRRNYSRVELGRVQQGDQAVFFVRDNGVGFDMAYKDKLFGAFQRLHGAEFEGTGIGLATVKRIVERHGGRVWAESVLDEGTTIRFTLC